MKIKFIYDCKLGTPDLYVFLKDMVEEIEADENDTSPKRFVNYTANTELEQCELFKDYLNDTATGEWICELLTDYFSDSVLRDDDFVENADIFDITNVRIKKERKIKKLPGMSAGSVLKTLHITRPTLSKYVKEGIIKVVTMPNGKYSYDRESVYTFLEKGKNN